MKVLSRVLLFAVSFCKIWLLCQSTCVLESDFGLVINCAFKKSSLFRVRNLGGVKAHISWGLTIGDELGFKESLSNVEFNNKRSVQGSKIQAQLVEAQQKAQKKKALVIPPPTNSSELDNATSEASVNGTVSEVTKFVPDTTLEPNFAVPQQPPSEATNVLPDKIDLRSSTSSLESVPSFNETVSNYVTTDTNTSNISTSKPSRKKSSKSRSSPRRKPSRILIAPSEYHPTGYSKSFDNNFVSRVKLPNTTFQCKNQKYLPGLYADEELGCMFFHVCALVDTGGVAAKTYLCPESTLFDQSILKCNWWFYVDCKQSSQKYDTNIPVMRSYQLIRALAAIIANRRILEGATNTKDKQ